MSRWVVEGVKGMKKRMQEHRGLFAVLMAGTMLLGALACEDSDKIPPADSTISLAATPSTILLGANNVQVSDIDILATVYSGIGVPLPGQDVRFSTNSGELCIAPKATPTECRPGAAVPIETDDIGNAHVILQGARTNTTIQAKSGKAEVELQLQTATCEIQTIELAGTIVFTACTGPNSFADLIATVTDTDGAPCSDISVTFKATAQDGSAPPDEDVTIVFSPNTIRTDAAGQAKTTVSLGADCANDCINTDCNTSDQVIFASGGGIDSSEIPTSIDVN